MKLRLYFRPGPVVVLVAGMAAFLWWMAAHITPWLLPFALFYSALAVVAAWSWWRIYVIERWTAWSTPARLLILAPHEDDCVIAAGGVGALNQRIGGITRI